MDMEKTRKSIQTGTFEMAFGRCELRQCDAENPIVYAGPGLVTQNAERRLVVRVFAEPVDIGEALDREFNRSMTVGKLTAEDRYYDLTGVDLHGNTWTTERVWVSGNFGATGTYLLVEPNRIDATKETNVVNGHPKVRTFIPADIKLPWHQLTDKGALGASMDRFENDMGVYRWAAHKEQDGVRLEFTAKDRPVWPAFEVFWRAMSLLVGRALPVAVFQIAERKARTDRLVNDFNADLDADLLTPFPLKIDHARDAHAFIEAYLRHALIDTDGHENHDEVIFQAWDRILRANESDIRNSALVLSVAIESVIKAAMTSEEDTDPEFVAQVNAAKKELKVLKGKIGDRAWNAMMSSLGNAVQPRPKSVLLRLVKQGAINQLHADAWSDLRNTSAHGVALNDTREDLQVHFDDFHTCLNLFYRLVFLIVGYRGVQQDFSTTNWPVVPFPPEPVTDIVAASVAAASTSTEA